MLLKPKVSGVSEWVREGELAGELTWRGLFS